MSSLRTHVGSQSPRKNLGSYIDASHSRQPLVKGERLVRYEVNAVMAINAGCAFSRILCLGCQCVASGKPEFEMNSFMMQLACIFQAHLDYDAKFASFLLLVVLVTPEGVLLLARCHASATLESHRASSREHLPRQKLM